MTGLSHLLHRTIAGKYRIDKMIGRGGGAAVFLATHTEMERTVAIKLLYPKKDTESMRLRFKQEARLISQFRHPNTITVFDYGEHENSLYLVMEFIEGGSLDEYVDKHGAQSTKRAVEMTLGILGSLEEAHYHGVLHRDLKPENIMLTQSFKGEWIPKVVDFGIAKVLRADDEAPEGGILTQENAFVGTPRYTAPEQILSDDISPSADLYNVGLIMWFMLTGEAPIPSTKVKDCLKAHLSKKPWILPVDAHVPETLAAIVHRALLKDRKHRYSSAPAMIEDLEQWLKQPTGQATATLKRTKAVINELVHDIEENNSEDSWMFDQSHIIDPNVMHTSEVLGMSASSFDFKEMFLEHPGARPTMELAHHDGLMEMSAPAVQMSREDIQEHAKERVAPLHQTISTPPPRIVRPASGPASRPTESAELDVVTVSAEIIAVKEPPPRAPVVESSSSSSSSASALTPIPVTPSPRSGSNRGVVIAIVSAMAMIIGVSAVGLLWKYKRQTAIEPPENSSLDNGITKLDKAVSDVKKQIPVLANSKKKGSKFTGEGLILVVRSQQWQMATAGESEDLSSFTQRLYLFYKKSAKLEVAVFVPKNTNVAKTLMAQTKKPGKAMMFDHLVIRLTPLNKKATRELPSLVATFEKYRTMVEEHEPKSDSKSGSTLKSQP